MSDELRISSVAGVPLIVSHSSKPGDKFGPIVSFKLAETGSDGQPMPGGGAYYYSTLAGTDRGPRGPRQRGAGLRLHGGVPAWNIDGETMDRVMDWLLGQLGRPPVELYVVDDLPF